MSLETDTVAIPVARGINVNTPARLVDAQELLEAQNVRFTAASGARKRRGHNGQRIRGAKAIPAGWTLPQFLVGDFYETFDTDDRNIYSDWLLGYGYAPADEDPDYTAALPSATHPDGIAFGSATRDNELLTWDGNRLLSRTSLDLPGGQFAEFNACMPALRSEPFAKTNTEQKNPDVADNGTIRVAVWISGSKAYASVFDSQQGTLIQGPSELTPILQAQAVRAVPVGPWVHLFISEADTGTLQVRSVHQSTPLLWVSSSLGECTGYFDVWKASDSSVVVAQTQPGNVIKLRYLGVDATLDDSQTPDLDGTLGIKAVALCVHPTTSTLALVWRTTTEVRARCYQSDGTPLASSVSLGTVTSTTRAVAVAPKYLTKDGNDYFSAFWDDYNTYGNLSTARFNSTGAITYSASAFNLFVGSQAVRAGDRTYVWAARNSAYQSSWVLLDESLKPVGRAEYAAANTPSGSSVAYTNFSVNWAGTAEARNRSVFHCAMSTRVRVAIEPTTAGVNPPAVYSEPYIKFARLDFLPRLRSAQAGRSTYFAGAQLWAYDGAELTENCFLFAPEDVTVAQSGSGDLTADGKYIYRVDLCYRNAQNEEIRSASYYTEQITLSGNTATQLTIPTSLTRRENAYILIFRNESVGTVWYLCNSRDPSSPLFLKNDQSVQSVTYTDSTVSDAELISREQHPNQSFNHLDPFSAPASEVIAAGRDRLWLAGGEIPAGQVYPSRLFEVGETPAFHANLAVQVDRSAEPITAVSFVGEYTVFFRKTHNYILDGIGPDNEQDQLWSTPRRSLTDVGAVSQESVAQIAGGIAFQSPAGIKLFTPGGGLMHFGQNVDALSRSLNITAAVVVGQDQEVRFYAWDGTTLVYNYQYSTWSTWTVAAAGAVLDPVTNLVAVTTPDGTFLQEADGVWTDNSGYYKQRIRFAWLRAGNLLDWQQVRRIGAVGESHGDHSVHVDVYYNEREFAEEWFDWEFPDTSNNDDTFGSGNFGDGNFGDDDAVEGIELRDSTWSWRRRLFRRKCSVISVAIDDNNTIGEGFTLSALALELAKKPGLDRTPWRGGTFNNTGGNGSAETGK